MSLRSKAQSIPLEYALVLLGLLAVAGVFNPLLNDLGTRADGYTDANPTRLLTTLLIYSLALALAVLRWRRTQTVLAQNLLILAVIALPLISVVWSVDPGTTLRRATAHGLAVVFCLYVASTVGIHDLFRRLTLTYFIGAVLSFVYVVTVPDLAVHDWGGLSGSRRGVYGHKAELGQAASIGIIVGLFAQDRTRAEAWVRLATLATSLVLLIMSRSATHWLIVFALLMLIPIGSLAQQRRITAGLRIASAIILTLIAIALLSLSSGLVLDVLGRDLSFSGRTTLWRGVSDVIEGKFQILGAGYGAFFTPSGALPDLTPYMKHWGGIPNHAHSGYLDTRANLGLPGLGVLGALILVSLWRVTRKLVWGPVDRVWIRALALQGLFLASNISGSTAFRHTDMAWVLFLMVTCYAAPELARARSPARYRQTEKAIPRQPSVGRHA